MQLVLFLKNKNSFMRNCYVLLCLFSGLFACSESPKNGNSTSSTYNFSLETDTLMVDSKGEIILAARGYMTTDVTADRRHLVYFENKTHEVEWIDLDKMELAQKEKYEKEGPKGVGNFVNNLILLPNENLALTSYMQAVVLDKNGNISWNYKPRDDFFKEDEIQEGEQLSPAYLFSDSNSEFFTLLANFSEYTKAIARVNMEENTIKRIPISELEELKRFRILYEQGNGKTVWNANIFLTPWKNSFIVSNAAQNKIVIYDPQSDSIYTKTYTSTLTPNEKTGEVKNDVSSREEFQAESKKLREQIEFGKWNWDTSTNQFYRISHVFKSKVENEDAKYDVYLTVFDSDLTLLGETKVPSMTSFPGYHFAKNGYLYFHTNLEDELAFVRLKIAV